MARRFKLGKLVPTGVIGLMKEADTVIESHTLTDEETFIALMDKIIEEATEAKKAPQALRGAELADIRIASKAAEAVSGILPSEIDDAEVAQRAKKGSFLPGVFVVSVTVRDDDPMAEYYASDPERFPEVPPEES
jgi:hypothetical protein